MDRSTPALTRFLGIAILGFAACANAAQTSTNQGGSGQRPPNILLIIGDDMGIESIRSFGVGGDAAPTPNLDRLAASGVRFNKFWVQPVCSPTRATMITGRYGFRTGIGRPTGGAASGPLPPDPPKPAGAPIEGGRWSGAAGNTPPAEVANATVPSPGLRADEYTLPKAFAARPELGYATAAIGKWHLADKDNGWEKHPNLVGFDHFSGDLRGAVGSFFAWVKDVNGTLSTKTGYGPSDQVDDATAWIKSRGDRPWFMWFAFNLAHTPLHLPPKSLWVSDHSNVDPKANPSANPKPYFKAMIEAMDTEIGRLLAAMTPEVRANTYVIFMGDNGSTGDTISAPFTSNHAKGTAYEGGVNTPLIVSGPGVARNGVSNALVNSSDMFATILEMARIPRSTVPASAAVDSVSFFPYLAQPGKPSIRNWVYADTFTPEQGYKGGQYAIRNAKYKLFVRAGKEEFYEIEKDLAEARNLLDGKLNAEQQTAYNDLRRQLTALHGSAASFSSHGGSTAAR